MIGVTTAIILDKRIKRNNGTYAVKLRVTYNRDQKYYPLGKHLTPEDWNRLHLEKVNDKELKRVKLLFADIEKKAVRIIDGMEIFSFQLFEKFFNDQPRTSLTVLESMNLKIEELNSRGQINTAVTFSSTYKSIQNYQKTLSRGKLQFADITPEWLNGYEKWMLEKKSSITTIGIYLRNLRVVINQAIVKGVLPPDLYPFGKNKYLIPAARNTKKALEIGDIQKIVEYKPLNSAEAKARDMWLFSYLCNGLNVKDIARLKNENITKNQIAFIRSKTERTTRTDQKKITVIRIPEIDSIISRWEKGSHSKQDYVFDILDLNDSPEQQVAKIAQATKTINKYMKRIGKALQLDIPLTTYVARHSFATVLKRSGAPIEFISESLGHKDLKTTENYLDSFESDQKKSYQLKLLEFPNKSPK